MSIIDQASILLEVQRKIKDNWDLSTGEAAKEIYSSLYDLTGQVILLAQKIPTPDPLPIPDQLSACLVENQSLKARVASLDSLMNGQTDCLHKIGAALQADQLTAVELIGRALDVMTELIALRAANKK